MCDDGTLHDSAQTQMQRGISRRDFAILSAAAIALAGCAGVGASTTSERIVQFTTPDGIADGFFAYPAGKAAPAVIMWPDIAGLRDVFKVMARRLAAAGYAVLVPNPYYRNAPAPVLTSISEWLSPAGRVKLQPMLDALTPAGTMRDATAFASFLDNQPETDQNRQIGTCGYCMGGASAVRTAAATPKRIGAVASFHGANLVSDDLQSPVHLIAQARADFLFAIANNDNARDPEAKVALEKAAADAGRPAIIEVYPADHGWCVADNPSYDPNAADHAWEQMLKLFSNL